MQRKISSSISNAKNCNSVKCFLCSSTSDRIIEHQVVKNSAERKRGRVLVPEWKEKDGRYSQKIRYRTEEVWVLTKENNRLVLKPERADFFKWQKERLE